MQGEWTAHDITKVTDDDIREIERTRGKIQVICGGFPCQAFSVAGKRGGFSDTRGTLFFEIARFASILRPDYLFLENVTGLLSHENGSTFETILRTLDELGYRVEWQVLNSKDFGVPQNRERVFIIGHLGGGSGRTVFPIRGENPNTIKQLGNIDQHKRERKNPQTGRVYDPQGLSPCLNTCGGGGLEVKIMLPCLTPARTEKRQNGPRFKKEGEPMFTLTTQDIHGIAILRPVRTEYGKAIRKRYENGDIEESRHNMTVLEPRPDGISNTLTTVQKDNLLKIGDRIRNLTPREYWRGQGFPDWAFDLASKVCSNSQLYKQAGNSVTVNVIAAIAGRLRELSGEMTFLDTFAGIGGFRLGMESAGHTCKGFVEWDKYARMSYQAIHLGEATQC